MWPGSHVMLQQLQRGLLDRNKFCQKQTVRIPVGSCLLMRHCALHAGSAYTGINIRLHAFLDVRTGEDHTNVWKIRAKLKNERLRQFDVDYDQADSE